MISIGVASKSMTMNEIKAKAKALGVEPGKMKKVELIHAVQIAEGCTPNGPRMPVHVCTGRCGKSG